MLGSIIDIKIGSVQKLITIENDKINLINQIPINKKPIKICSFLGNARTGKSTLMNCYISNLLDTNTKIFNTASKLKTHCTTGIDMLLIEMFEYDLILLDVQGLELQDSRDDCKLMLFVYLISNMIIFNPKTILDNSVLSSLQSLTSIITYVENIGSNDNKPLLLFRPRDINEDAEFDSNDNLEDMLSSESKDQFQNVRESIKKLFNPIESVPTYSLDKTELKLLSSDKFIQFMKNSSNGFTSLSIYINQMLNQINYHDATKLNSNLIKIIHDINSNKKIDYEIFDVTKREANVEIREWFVDTIDNSQYDIEIIYDGTQINYDEIIQPRINYRDMILDKFDERFNKTTPKIRDTKRAEILETFNKHINNAVIKSTEIANSELTKIFNTKINTYTKQLCNTNFEIDKLMPLFEELNNYLKESIWLDCVKETYINKLNLMITNFKEEALIKMNEYKSKYEEYINSQIKLIIDFIEEHNPMKFVSDDFYIPFETIITNIREKYNKVIITKLKYQKYMLSIKINNDKFTIKFFTGGYNIPYYEILVYIKNTKELSKYEVYDDQDYTALVKDYYLNDYEEEFKLERYKRLPKFLSELHSKNINCNSDWISVKKSYVDNVALYDKLIKGGNDVKFVNILDTIIDISTEITTFELNMIASKYAFIVNKLHIHNIYTIEDYEKIYNDISVYQYQINQDNNKYLKYILTMKIIDILFEKALIIK